MIELGLILFAAAAFSWALRSHVARREVERERDRALVGVAAAWAEAENARDEMEFWRGFGLQNTEKDKGW